MKMKNFLVSGLVAGLIFCLHSCESNSDNLEPDPVEVENPVINKAVFSGFVQKGPFSNGSSVTILELNENLDQTGKTYFTTISDNLGSFEQKNIDLVSNFVSLKADGYYFNEVSGETSTGQITLYALVDIEDVNSANVNVLTHLARARIEYLVQQGGALSFMEAKQQAQKEVLAVFGISTVESANFESLDLTNNASLLAISSILQGPLSTGDMAGLMADIITDIRADGKLDNMALITKLVHNAQDISSSTVRNNLMTKYTELGMNTSIPDFASNVRLFIDSKTDPSAVITYPENGGFGANILSDAVTSVIKSPHYTAPYYSMKADVPLGMSLKIVMNDQNRYGTAGSLWIMPDDYFTSGWHIGLRDQYSYTEEFSVMKSGVPNDLKIGFPTGIVYEADRDYIIIEYYENGSITPTKVKKLYLVEP